MAKGSTVNFLRTIAISVFLPGIFCCPTLFAQQATTPSASSPRAAESLPTISSTPLDAAGSKEPAVPTVREFPVLLQQKVVAGKTQVGTKVQAKLGVATLVEGKVIPRNAVFSGEIVESSAKTASAPSRLAIKMDSVQWKTGSATITTYLTAWYYPTTTETGQDLRYGPPQDAKTGWNGQGAYPDPNSKSYKPFPGSDTGQTSSVPDTPSSAVAHHRIPMKDVDTTQSDEGIITISSSHMNLKLDRLTTYVLATGNPQPAK
jgi:hypothetical protein